MFPAVLGNTLGGLCGGVVIARTGLYKSITIAGSIICVACYGVLILRWRGETGWWETMEIIPGGFGMGVCMSSEYFSFCAGSFEMYFNLLIRNTGTFIALTSGLDKRRKEHEGVNGQNRDMASATSGFFVMIPLGLIMGIAIASSVQVGMVRSLLGERLRAFENAEEVSDFISWIFVCTR